MTKTSNVFNTLLTGVVVVAILLLIIVALNSNQQPSPSTDNNDTQEQQGTVTLVELDNKRQIKLGDKQLTLPQKWEVQTAYSSDQGTGYHCVQESCTIYIVGNQDSKLGVVAISLPGHLVTDNNVEVGTTGTKFQFLGKSMDMRQISAIFYAEDPAIGEEPGEDFELDEEQKIPVEVFGCEVEVGVCFNSTFSTDAQLNKTQLDEFKTFLQGVKIN